MGLSTKQVSGDFPAERLGSPEMQKSPPSLPPSLRRQPLSQQQSELLKCPRCGSTNTKFCYYNNYNKSQPRHFCKSCKRHWTRGGTLRNVPVGGGRKNKLPKISGSGKLATCGGGRHDRHFYPSSANIISGNQKSTSNGLYHALNSSPLLLEKSDNGGKAISSSSLNSNTGPFQFSGLSLFKTSNSLNHPISYYESLDAFGPHQGNLDSIEESTITSANNILSYTSNGSWPGPAGDGSLDLLDYWNWNEIGVLPSSDYLNVSWDDGEAEIKP